MTQRVSDDMLKTNSPYFINRRELVLDLLDARQRIQELEAEVEALRERLGYTDQEAWKR